MDLFGKMGRTVQTGKAPICVDEADDKGYAVLLPARLVNECSKDKLGGLVGIGRRRYGDENNSEGY